MVKIIEIIVTTQHARTKRNSLESLISHPAVEARLNQRELNSGRQVLIFLVEDSHNSATVVCAVVTAVALSGHSDGHDVDDAFIVAQRCPKFLE